MSLENPQETIGNLSSREVDVFRLLLQGFTNQQIAVELAVTRVLQTPTTIVNVEYTVFDQTDNWSTVWLANAFSVQNVMTHEFGHWLLLGDIKDKNCKDVTMYESISPLNYETKKITLEAADMNGINWQYP